MVGYRGHGQSFGGSWTMNLVSVYCRVSEVWMIKSRVICYLAVDGVQSILWMLGLLLGVFFPMFLAMSSSTWASES